jgi:hypothetical protein
MVAVDYDDPSVLSTGRLLATAQFFNRLREYSPEPDGVGESDPIWEPSPPPKRFLMVRERILVHTTANEDALSFQVVGDNATIADTIASDNPVYELHAASDVLQRVEYLRDQPSRALYIWSPDFSESATRIAMLEHFVCDFTISSPLDPSPATDALLASYWD